MKFTTLEIVNFLAISEAKISLADRGLVLIQGANDDDPSATSNGAGKSTLVDALCWALYGTTARGLSGDAVVNKGEGKNCVVAITIEDGDDVWRISRHRKHKAGKNALKLEKLDPVTSLSADLTAGTDKLTQEKVDKILGCSHDVFTAAVYAGQEAMPDLPGMTDKQLKVLVEEAAGVQALDDAYRIALGDVNKAKVEVGARQNDVDRLERAIASADEEIERLEEANEKWAIGQKAKIAGHITNVRSAAEDYKKRRADNDMAQSKIDGFIVAIAAIDAKLLGLEEERDTEKALEGELRRLERISAADTAVEEAAARDTQSKRQAHRGIEGRVGTLCGECGKPYEEHDLDEAKKIAEAALVESANKLREAKSAAERAIADAQRARERLEVHRASMTDASAIVAQRASLQAEVDAHERQRRAEVETLRSIDIGKKEVDALRLEKSPFDAVAVKSAERRQEHVEALESATENLDVARIALKHADAVAKVFSPAGVRAHVLDTVTPHLNDRTATYLGALSDGSIEAVWSTLTKTAKGELKERFAIDVTNDNGGESFAALSGGEKRKVRIATALALQDLVTSRATKSIDLFIGDEIDDALDAAGLERLMGILEEKARERGSVFVVSHRNLKDWISQVVVVTKKGGKSTIEEGVS